MCLLILQLVDNKYLGNCTVQAPATFSIFWVKVF
ncbi:hypothetical protein SLEP1_g51662 [Rubroshorea leprosula]|uniref:Uncharacterized protein n=1 Tax=Rubroshorea leprosula TaxID=152421 RepID=A0AAV5M3Z3_9ROSI|nr:hypothetical protein SLEP1_g51662 [Rubroshorea leprosula]